MNTFRTAVSTPDIPKKINYQDKLLAIGSCFTQNIGAKFAENFFNIQLNPFGIVYNPYSISRSLKRILSGVPYTQDDLIHHEGIWLSLDHHGNFSHQDPELCLYAINESLQKAHELIHETDHLLITFGTAGYFRYLKTGKPVANCHKLPACDFVREEMQATEIALEMGDALSQLFQANPNIQITLSISPVRYMVPGAIENTFSKARLAVAVETLVHQWSSVSYFPAYEIMLDDLRDYRFYDEDMIHPNPQAIQYIWERVQVSMLTPEANTLMKQISELNAARNHRVRQPGSHSHKEFCRVQYEKAEKIQRVHPYLELAEILSYFKDSASA